MNPFVFRAELLPHADLADATVADGFGLVGIGLIALVTAFTVIGFEGDLL